MNTKEHSNGQLEDVSPDDLLTYREVSALTGVPVGSLYAKVHLKQIAHVRLSPRTVRFRRRDIEAWIESGYTAVA